MEIGLIYSRKDPQQIAARDYIRKFVADHGILANIVESEKEVNRPLITVNGCDLLGENRAKVVSNKKRMMIPSMEEIASALERTIWSL